MLNVVTPIVKINDEENNIYIKRDDLLPFSFGGNKVRISEEFFLDMLSKKKNCIIGYGNARSNLSRAIANMAYAKGIPCHIISPADDDGKRVKTNNSRIVNSCNVVFHECSKTNVAETVKAVIEECENAGLSPYYIYGNELGKGNESTPVEAYVKAYLEIKNQSAGLHFDYIFLATGTGMTQAGIIAGKKIYGGKETVIGISIARKAEDEKKVLSNFITSYSRSKNISFEFENDVFVVDDYLCGGYGKYNSEIKNTINRMFKQYGMPLDPTYTGKAFYGMNEYLAKNKIKGKNILFIHTGGTPLFFDYLKELNNAPLVCECKDANSLSAFLNAVDNCLPVPLSTRVNIDEYSKKVCENGKALTISKNGEIVSAALFYCNDCDSKKAYLTLIATRPGFEGHGYADLILKKAESIAKECGMAEFHLDTDLSNYRAIAFYSNREYKITDISGKVHMVKKL